MKNYDEEKNAVIHSLHLGSDDHGGMTIVVTLDFGGTRQGFGGYALYSPTSLTEIKRQGNIAGHFIWRVLRVVVE